MVHMLEQVPATTADALDAVDHARQHRRAAEVAEKIALLRAAELYEITSDTVDEWVEQLLPSEVDGVPPVGEFLAYELGPILGVSPSSAFAEISQVLWVRHRHPVLWEAFLEGTLWWWQAGKIAEACLRLDVEQVAEIDRRCAHALTMWPWTRLWHHLPAWILQVDPDAETRERYARTGRRMDIGTIEDGHCHVQGKLAADDAIAFEQAIAELAKQMVDPELPEGIDFTDAEAATIRRNHRRASAVGELARRAAGQDPLEFRVELVVHIDANTDPFGFGTGIARVEGWGNLLASCLPDFLAGSKVIVRPVLDPGMVHASDAYQPSELMRLAAETRNPVDVFPHGSRPTRSCDLDHTEPYRDDGTRGQTGLHNLGPLSRRAHRAKTHGGWRLAQPEPGVYWWRSPMGYEYLVTAAGTTRLLTPSRQPQPPEEPIHLFNPERWADPPPEDPVWDTPPPSHASQAWVQAQLFMADLIA